MLAKRDIDYSLYVILGSDAARGRPLLALAQAAVRGGATILQLREKKLTSREYCRIAQELREWTRTAGVPLIINDRVDIALAVNADGVHVGPDDLTLETARQLLGPDKIIGVSAGTLEEAREAECGGADYIGVGSVFATTSKADAGEPIGVEGFRAIARAVRIPAVAIGGITPENVAHVIAAGAAGVAVISAVVGAEDVEGAAQALRERIEGVKRWNVGRLER